MFSTRRTLIFLIVLTVLMIILLLLLIFAWIFVTLRAVWNQPEDSTVFWTFLPLGSLFLTLLLTGVIIYLVTSIKVLNLNVLQSSFMDSMTHELKTPIASLKLYLQTISRYGLSIHEEKAFLTHMMEDVERLDRLITQVVRAGQLGAGQKIAGSPETFWMSELLQEITREMTSRHQKPLSCVQLKISEEEPITTSRILLEIIFRNLIDNALKYSGEEPLIHVSVRQTRNGQIAARVVDNGPGIPRNLQKKVFHRFYRIGRELERSQKGTGLGLYIVKMCVQQLHGEIRVVNNTHRVGTTFILRIPVSEKKEEKEKETLPIEKS
ncbi:MAG: HAMP domain-containing sensor histidine kinase [Planctomycetia bacterium]|nr:HAMP domain-containing sensor histidine kinase [Planctomycetia bacterium]